MYNVSLRSRRQSAIARMMSTVGTSIIRRRGRSITGCTSIPRYQMYNSLSTILRFVAQKGSYIQIMRCLMSVHNVSNRCVSSIHNIPNHSRCGDWVRCEIPRRKVPDRCAISRHNVSNHARYGDRARCAISSHLVRRLTTGDLVITDRGGGYSGRLAIPARALILLR